MITMVTMSQYSQQFGIGYKPKIIFFFGLKLGLAHLIELSLTGYSAS